jgi:hypothetical protein
MGCISHPPLACRPSPPQGGRLAVRTACPKIATLLAKRLQCGRLISPLEGEMAGRPEGGGNQLDLPAFLGGRRP